MEGGAVGLFRLATGYGRKYAVKMLRGRLRLPPRKRSPRTWRYGSAFRSALKVCWKASEYLCSQRLQPFLPDLVLILRRHGQLTCAPETEGLRTEASVATVERNLGELRRVLVGRRMR